MAEDQNANEDAAREKYERRAMMIFAAAGTLLILAIMGANMLLHSDSPVSTEMSSQSRKAPSEVTLTRDHVGEAIRYLMYSSFGASRVPFVLHEAFKGNYSPIAQFLMSWRAATVRPRCGICCYRPTTASRSTSPGRACRRRKNRCGGSPTS